MLSLARVRYPKDSRWLAFAAVISAVIVISVSLSLDHLYGEAVLFGLVVPLTLGAGAWGRRGGVVSGVACSVLAAVWWLEEGQHGGIPWIASRAGACLAVGLLLGWLIDSSRRLASDLAHQEEFSLDLIVTANFEGYFTHISPSVTRILGYTKQEILERPFLEFVHPDDIGPTLQAVAIQESGGEISSFENRYRCKDGNYRWLEWTSRPDPDSREMVAVARDISERKDLESRERTYQESLESAVLERTRELESLAFELVEANHETLGRLAIAAEYRDDGTHAHTLRVANVSASLAEELGLDPAAVELIREAAILHDVGKVGVPDAILLKQGKLTEDEFDRMKTHTTIGRSILAGSHSEILRAASAIASSHHEWWDGTGYPDGIGGDSIPLFGRIVALADVYDALTHERPYKPAWPHADAVAEIKSLSGRQFDPEVVAAFEELDHSTIDDPLVAAGRSYSHNGAFY